MSNTLDLSNAIDLRIANVDVRQLRIANVDIWTKFVESWRNLVTNPSMETAAGTVEVRRNLNINPRMENTTNGWSVAGTGVTQTPQPGGTRINFASALVASIATMYESTMAPAIPGESWYGAMDVTVPAGQPAATMSIGIRAYDSTSNAVVAGGAATTGSITIAPGTTVRLTSPVLAFPALSAGARLWLNVATPGVSAGSHITVKNAMLEKTGVNTMPYFDGTTAAAGDFSYVWTGAANASASVQQALGVASLAAGGASRGFRSTEWSRTGQASVRNRPLGISNDTYVVMGGDTGGMRLGMEAGKTYTALLTVRIDKVQVGPFNAVARAIRPLYRIGLGGYNPLPSTNAPNVVGEHLIRHTFTLPAGTTEAFIRLQNGSSNPADEVWMDDFALVEGTYAGPYFDGSTPADATHRYEWLGAANASASRELVPA